MKKNLAISYGMKRKAKKMAKGGGVDEIMTALKNSAEQSKLHESQTKGIAPKKMAQGGQASMGQGQKPKPSYVDQYGDMDQYDPRGAAQKRARNIDNQDFARHGMDFGKMSDPNYSYDGYTNMYAKGGSVSGDTPYIQVGYPSKLTDEWGSPIASQDRSGFPFHNDQQYQSGVDPFVSRLMAQRARGYSEGGMVANDDEPIADSKPNEFDDLALNDDLESSYTGENSGDELGNAQESEDRDDIVEKIMRSRSKKDRNPRPA